ALRGKGVARDASAVDAATTVRMATLGGARALGWEDRIGSLVVGKQADLAAVCMDALEVQPVYHLISQLIYASSRRQVSDVWIAGIRKVQDGELLGIDSSALLARTER